MPRNGSGSFGLVAGNPVVPSTVISSTWANNTLNDIASGLTQSIANDGQTTPVANLPMATFRHTNVGNAAARNDYAAAGQVQDSSLQWLTSVAGTNTITASITPSPTAYVAGQTFRFVPANTNTGATTLNINGLGAKNITKDGAHAVAAGNIISGAVVEVIYDGTQFQMNGVPSGQLIDVQYFTSSGASIWTKPAGCNSVIVEVVGGGGAGGGAPATGAGAHSIGGGGGGGGYAFKQITTGLGATETVTVGAGGAGVAGFVGNTGGTSSFGAHCSATGGGGGGIGGPSSSSPFYALSGTGGIGSGGDLNLVGGVGQLGLADVPNATTTSGSGASSIFSGGGPRAQGNSPGNAPPSIGGGGGGGASNNFNGPNQTGGNGGSGLVIVKSFT